MLNPRTAVFDRLHRAIQALPVIDCHEHMAGPGNRPPYKEPIAALTVGYMQSDLQSAGGILGYSGSNLMPLWDHSVSSAEKWPLFEKLWQATEHTAYARVTKLVLENVYGETALNLESLGRVAEKLQERTDEWYSQVFEEASIRAVLTDALGRWFSPTALPDFLNEKFKFPSNFHPLLPLPDFHPTQFGDTIPWVESIVDRSITSLDEFLEAVYEIFEWAGEMGVIGLKDQSAYQRDLAYGLPDIAEAERQFNHLLSDPRQNLGWPEGRPLNDYLFHQYMRFARELEFPVQIHTGHMAGIYNRVDKTNAALLTTVLELHKEVQFDLFHGNWPYLGDLLFLGKNYPNTVIDLCWLHIIDPRYAGELLERSVLTMPHTKIHGFGGDYGDSPEFSAAHLEIAREVITGALSNLVASGWLEETSAVQIAADWLFNNPNRFFKLGFDEISV